MRPIHFACCILVAFALTTETATPQPFDPSDVERREWKGRDEAVGFLLESYRRLSARFNRELAGRFPFGSLESRDANPEVVRAFFQDEALAIDQLRHALQVIELGPRHGKRALAFLGQLDTVSSFVNENPGALKLTFTPQFAAAPQSKRTKDPNAFIWRLGDGLDDITYPEDSVFVYHQNQGIVFEWVWENLGSWSAGEIGSESPFQARDGNRSRYVVRGPWALLRLLKTQAVSHDSAGFMLEFKIPLTLGTKEIRYMPLFVKLGVHEVVPKLIHRPIAIPKNFPYMAPDLHPTDDP